jgi:hypothetical protein
MRHTNSGNISGKTESKSVCVSGCHSNLPVGKTKTALKFLSDVHGILGWKHKRNSFLDTISNLVDGCVGGMSGHGSGITSTKTSARCRQKREKHKHAPKAEIKVLVTINVPEILTLTLSNKNGVAASPANLA